MSFSNTLPFTPGRSQCKGVVVDTATKCNVLCDTVISALEVVNGKRLKLQIRGLCPSVAIDKTDGCLTYLSAEAAVSTTFVTSKSSEMNVSWPDKDGDYQEKAIPEQVRRGRGAAGEDGGEGEKK